MIKTYEAGRVRIQHDTANGKVWYSAPDCPIDDWLTADPRATIKWPAIKAALKRKGFPL